jgi:hypothetical protein
VAVHFKPHNWTTTRTSLSCPDIGILKTPQTEHHNFPAKSKFSTWCRTEFNQHNFSMGNKLIFINWFWKAAFSHTITENEHKLPSYKLFQNQNVKRAFHFVIQFKLWWCIFNLKFNTPRWIFKCILRVLNQVLIKFKVSTTCKIIPHIPSTETNCHTYRNMSTYWLDHHGSGY